MAGAAGCDSPKTGTVDSGVSAWDFGDDPLAIRLNVADGSDVFACGAGFSEAQVEADLLDAITNAPHHCQGSEGNYVCDCDGAPRESYAFSCHAALLQACEVEAELVDGSGDEPPAVAECSALSREIQGSCTLNDDEGYDCACDGEADTTVESEALTQASCDQALFGTCAQTCADDFGACMPSPRGTLGEYDCTCTTNGFTHVSRASSCEGALLWACNPLNEAEEVCTGYGGACVVTDRSKPDELTCTCVDGTSQVVDHVPASVEPRFRACRETLEGTCGLGTPPAGAQCVEDGNGYHARCTRGPSPSAALTCECYTEGERERVDRVEEHSCSMATLVAFCPEIAE